MVQTTLKKKIIIGTEETFKFFNLKGYEQHEVVSSKRPLEFVAMGNKRTLVMGPAVGREGDRA